MKLCLIADLHLPYHPSAVHYDVLEWALGDMLKSHVDAVVWVGDFTADGHPDALRRFREKLSEFGIPAVVIPGNSDYRTPETVNEVRSMTSPLYTEIGNCKILSLADGEQSVPEEAYALLEAADMRTVVCAHHPFHCLAEPHRSRLTEWRKKHPEIPLFVAHLHDAGVREDGGYLLPAADPDKNIGASPAILYYDTETGEIRHAHYDCPVPSDFRQYLGLSCRRMQDIGYAVSRGLSCIELRGELLSAADDVLSQIECWRNAGGQVLSLHAPEIILHGSYNIAGWDEFGKFAETVSADRITLHVPNIPAHTATDSVLEDIAEFVCRKLDVLPDSFVIGLENLHTSSADTAENHRFGDLPEECLRFLRILRKHTDKKAGIHLDTGHARNNPPFSQRYTLGAWYAEVGGEVVGYHIHQCKSNGDGTFENHQPITDWYGKLISYASFFKAWQIGQLAKAPVLLEIRTEGGYIDTFDLLDRSIQLSDLHSHTDCGF